jgi:hypothetical protein
MNNRFFFGVSLCGGISKETESAKKESKKKKARKQHTSNTYSRNPDFVSIRFVQVLIRGF